MLQKLVDLINHVAGWRTFNDRLALLLLGSILGLWIATRWIQIPAEAVGASIAVFTLVAQFYFRTRPPAEPPSP